MITNQQDKNRIEKNLSKLADMLIINGTLLESPGLWYGRMGVAIFFFHYARYTGLELFEDYAVEIIEQIQKTIHQESPVDYSRGLAGIGTGIEYLAQEKYLDIDTNETLEDFDSQITREVMCRQYNDSSLSDGLTGLGTYFFYRTINPQTSCNDIHITINKQVIAQIVTKIEKTISSVPRNLPDVLLLLCKLHRLNICDLIIEDCINKFQEAFSPTSVSSADQPEMAFALMQIGALNKKMKDTACIYTENILQKVIQSGTIYIEETSSNRPDTLFWLMRCKRFVQKTNINTALLSQIEMLINKQIEELADIPFEEGKFSLKGCAGMGLVFISMLTDSDDAWLELYG